MAAGPFQFPPRHQSACSQATNAFVRYFKRYFPSCHTNRKQNNIVWLKQNFQTARRGPFTVSPKFWLLLSVVGLETINFENGTGKFHLDQTNKSQGSQVPRGIGELLQERSTNYNLRGKHILELPKVNTTTYRLKSWRYTAAKIWNALPYQFCAANKIGTFKNLMSKLDFSNFTF